MEAGSPTTYLIHLPKRYPLTSKKLTELCNYNPDLTLSHYQNNTLMVSGSVNYPLEEHSYIPIQLPGFTEELFDELHDANDEIHFEYENKEEVLVKMGVFRRIGKLAAKILASFVYWASEKECGEVYADPTEYKLDDPNEEGKKIRKIPDVSYISYDTASEETQDSWDDSFIPIPPNLAIEIVSAKNSLKTDLKKMEDVWIRLGVDVGLVICPFTETIYIFEKGNSSYKTQSIYTDFSHPYLVGYTDNYGKYLKKK